MRNGELIRLNDYRAPDDAGELPRASFIRDTVYLVNGIYYAYGWADAIDVYAYGRDDGAPRGSLSVPVTPSYEYFAYDVYEEETAVAEAETEVVGEDPAPPEPATAIAEPAD